MFESVLVESQRHVHTQTRWAAMAALAFQLSIAAAICIYPLLHPGLLPHASTTMFITVPPLMKPVQVVTARTSSGPAAPAEATRALQLPRQLPTHTDRSSETEPSVPLQMGSGIRGNGNDPNALSSILGPSTNMVIAGPKKPFRISEGVSEGQLLAPIRPIYPRIAQAAHQQGTVIVDAIISRTGTIENAHVVSGPAMLAGAALDAVRNARYRPFLLSGEPTEVETTIRINFILGG